MFLTVNFLFFFLNTVPGIICQNFRQIQIVAQYPLSSGPRSAQPCIPGCASAVDPQPIEKTTTLNRTVSGTIWKC